jgi:hypothetical protein
MSLVIRFAQMVRAQSPISLHVNNGCFQCLEDLTMTKRQKPFPRPAPTERLMSIELPYKVVHSSKDGEVHLISNTGMIRSAGQIDCEIFTRLRVCRGESGIAMGSSLVSIGHRCHNGIERNPTH